MALYDTNKNLIAGSRKTNIYRCDSFDEYEALPEAEKAKYDYVATPDAPTINTATPTEQLVSGDVKYIKLGNICTISLSNIAVNTSTSNRFLCSGLPEPAGGQIFFICESHDNFYVMNITGTGLLRDANNTAFGEKTGIYGSVTYICQ